MSNTDFNPAPNPTGIPPPAPLERQPPPPPPDPQRPPPQVPQVPTPAPGGAEAAVPPSGQPLGTPSPPTRAPGQWPSFDQPAFPPAVYRPPSPNRGPAGWGKPWEATERAKKYPGVYNGPDFPSPREGYAAVGGAATALSTHGSEAVAHQASIVAQFSATFAPLLDAISRGGFSRNYNAVQEQQMRGRIADMEIQRQQMLMHNDLMNEIHRKEMLDYGQIFELHRIGRISDEEARDELWALGIQTKHPRLVAMLQAKDIKGVEDLINWEDAQMRQSEAGGAAIKKATGMTGGSSAAEEWGDPSLSSGVGGGTPGSFAGRLPDAETKTASATTSDVDTSAVEGDESDYDKKLERDGYSKQEIEAIHSILSGNPSDEYKQAQKGAPDQKAAARKIAQGAGIAEGDIGKAIHGEGTQDEKLDAIAQISPERADKLRGLLDLHLDPEKDIPAVGKERETLTAQAHAINPNWSTNTFKLKQQFELANQPQVRAVQRVSAFVPAVNSLNADLADIPNPYQPIAASILKQVYAKTWSGDPTYSTLYTDIQNVLNETAAIQSGTGRPAVTNVNKRAQEMLATMSPAQIRQQLLRDARASYGMVRGLENQYKETVGDPNAQLPFFSRQVEADYRAIMRGNATTGEMPSDASGSVRATSAKFDPKAPHPSWIHTDPTDPQYNAWPPMTEAQVVEGRRQVRALMKSTNAADQATAQRIRKRLGEFAVAQPGDPDYAEEQQPR